MKRPALFLPVAILAIIGSVIVTVAISGFYSSFEGNSNKNINVKTLPANTNEMSGVSAKI